MHLAEGTLPLSHAVAWGALVAPVAIWSLRGEGRSSHDTASSSVLIAGVTSLLFAGTLLPLPVPVVGATSHICLTPVLALVVGVRRIVWPTMFVLLLQAVFFAHGGITTLGVNTLTLGVLGPVAAVGLWGMLRKLGVGGALGLGLACGAADLCVYLADAVVLAIALSDAASPAATFSAVAIGFAPVQGPLAVLEAVVSVGIARLLASRRPDIVPASLRALGNVAMRGASSAVLLLALGISGCAAEGAEDLQGIDNTVFGATAAGAGRPPIDSIVDLSGGETGLAMTIVILFGLGFLAGRTWERALGRGRDALSR